MAESHKKYLPNPRRKDSPKDIAIQNEIRDRANYSLALLGAGFIRHGSGHFLNLGLSYKKENPRRKNRQYINDIT